MFFNSLEFVAFFSLVLFVYYVVRVGWSSHKTFLLIASYVFYMAWSPPFGLLLFFSTISDYWIAAQMGRTSNLRARRFLLGLSCVVGIGILAFFKYSRFLFSNWMAVVPWPVQMPPFIEEIVLPMGVSFYTFQSMSYTIDVYRGVIQPERSFRDFALFVSFFPQLVAGPIVRASEFLPQLVSPRRTDPQDVLLGLDQIARGFAKKVLLADTLSIYVDHVFSAPEEFGSLNLLLAVYAYAFQIYYDFSGYSDIAIGSSRLLGFRLPVNFNLPYLAANPSDFWRRWHISLSTWLRDYLYISMGGSKHGILKTYRNLFLTMLLGGLWHGAAWGFVLWGAYHGALLVVHRLFYRERNLPGLPKALAVIVMFHLTCLGWIPFRAVSFGDGWTILERIAQFEGSLAPIDVQVWVALLLSVPLHVLGASATLKRLWERSWILPRAVFYASVALGILAFAPGATPFIYFQF